MDNDPDIANWVLEFILRQPISDQTLNSFLRTIPLPDNHHPHLHKCILLRTLQSHAARNSISLRTLDLIERLETIGFRNGNEPASNAMKRAYCAVAVEATVKRLFAAGGDGVSAKFYEAVKRVWKGRIGKMAGNKGLYSEELWAWKDAVEKAVWEDDVCERVVERSGSVDAVAAVERFLREEWGKMGPPFIELAAAKVQNDEGMKRVFGLGGDDHQEVGKDRDFGRVDQAVEEGLDLLNVGQEAAKEGCRVDGALGDNVTEEIPKKRKRRDKLVGVRRVKSLKRANVKIVDPDETTIGPSNYDLPGGAEVNEVREALVSSCSELHAIVKDPLPEALKISEQISGATGKDKGLVHGESDLLLVDSAGVVHGAWPSCSNANNVHKPSLMERNNSAHAYEWDGSIDGSEEDRDRPQLPSPQVIINPPLNKGEIGRGKKKRRTPRKWSPLEENTLRAEVQKYGKGQWKYILTQHRDIFENRTEVDLKDKWRNMTK